MVKGIDVYQKFQGTIDWSKVADAGVVDVFVKLTNGAGPAAVRGDTYVHGAHGAGLKVGGYHYALGGPAGPQADAFAAELERLDALDLAPALDFEDASLPTDTADRRAWIVAFFARLKRRLPGLTKVLLYSSGSELTEIHADTIALAGLTIEPWDAEYGPNDGGEHPVVHYTGRRAIHQYTSIGHVPGIGPAVDEDDITADITEDAVTTPAQTWGYENKAAGDTVDMHQALNDARSAAQAAAATGATDLAQDKANAATLAALTKALTAMGTVIANIQDTLTTAAGVLVDVDEKVNAAAAPVAGTYPVALTSTGEIVVGQPATGS